MNTGNELLKNNFLQNLESLCLSNNSYAEKFLETLMNGITEDGLSSTSIPIKDKNDEFENDSIIIYTNKLVEILYKINPVVFFEESVKNKYTIPNNSLIRFTLIIKLLQIILAKIVYLIPGAGIKNTNQENLFLETKTKTYNYRTSMITVYNLYKLLNLLKEIIPFSDISNFLIPNEINNLISDLRELLKNCDYLTLSKLSDTNSAIQRKKLLSKTTCLFSDYTQTIEKSMNDASIFYIPFSQPDFLDTLKLFLLFLEQTIKANRRSDGLYNSYNMIKISNNSISIINLPATIEGQAAVIASGYLSPSEVIQLIDAIKQSSLYSQSKHIYNAVEDFIPKINNHLELQKFLYIYKKRNDDSNQLSSSKMGIYYENGCIRFNSELIKNCYQNQGLKHSFAHFGIPITYIFTQKKSGEAIIIKNSDGLIEKINGTKIDYETSQKILANKSSVRSIEVYLYDNGIIA